MSESTTEQSSREQEREATLKDIRWRINDVRDMLIESKAFNGERLYGIDEWSTPAVNLASAIAKLDALIATLPPTAITAEEAGREGEAKDAWISDALRDAFGMASHHMTAVAQEYASAAYEQQRPSDIFHPAISKDGDQWCALYGDNLQDGVCGFGDTPDAAMRDFDKNWSKP